jgi:hypothetical protein
VRLAGASFCPRRLLRRVPFVFYRWNKRPQAIAPEYKRNGGNVMKTLVSMVVLALALAFTGPAFAGDVTKATNAADCEKAGGMWDASSNKCSEKKKDY